MDFFERPLNPNKHLKEEFVSGLTGSSMLEIAVLSTIVPALVVVRKFSFWGNGASELATGDAPKKSDDEVIGHKNWRWYTLAVALDYIYVILPILLLFTVLADWVFAFAVFLTAFVVLCILLRREKTYYISSFRETITSYRVSVISTTCLCILAVDFNIFPRRYAKTETYGASLMDLGVGSFVVANAMVSKQARNFTSVHWLVAVRSTLPLLLLGFGRLISTASVDYQVHVGEYGVHWNFFFTLAMISLLTSVIWIQPKYCGFVGSVLLSGYQVWLLFGLNEYLISSQRSRNIISQNKEGIFSLFGYWSMYLIGVQLGHRLLYGDKSCKNAGGLSSKPTVWGLWGLTVFFWSLAVLLDNFVERASRRMCNSAYVALVFAQNFQVLSVLSLAQILSTEKNLLLEDGFNRNMLGSFLLANVMTGVVNLSIDTLSSSTFTSLVILFLYSLTLCAAVSLANYCNFRTKFW